MLLALLACAAPPERPLSELRALLRTAVAQRQARVVIPPGVYRGAPEAGQRVHVYLRGARDLEILATGVTMVCTKQTRALGLDSCHNVTLSGLTIDYDPLPFTQGELTALDRAAGWIDVRIHVGYPVRADTRVDICDRQTRYRKRDKPFMWESRAEVRPDGVVRVHNKSAAGFAQVGDLISLGGWERDAVAHTLTLDDCARVTLRDVTVYASNCMGIVAAGGEGGHAFLGCRVLPGPPPPGASEARLLSTNADAILTKTLKVGARTEGCTLRDAGDDSWSVQSSDYIVLRREGRALWLASRDDLAVQAGDRLQATLDGPVATVLGREVVRQSAAGLAPEVEQKLRGAASWTYWWRLGGGSLLKVTLAADAPWQVGDSVYDLNRRGDGFVFRDNDVRSSGRVLIKAVGLVENNRIESPFGVSVLPEVLYPGAAGLAEVTIRGNTITEAHTFNPFYHSSQAGAISVTCDGARDSLRPAGAFGRVVIESNTITGGNGAGIVVSSAREVVLRGNRLVDLQHVKPHDTGGRYHIDNHAAIWLAHCDRVTLAGNELVNPGAHLSAPLVLGPGVKDVAGRADGLVRR